MDKVKTLVQKHEDFLIDFEECEQLLDILNNYKEPIRKEREEERKREDERKKEEERKKQE